MYTNFYYQELIVINKLFSSMGTSLNITKHPQIPHYNHIVSSLLLENPQSSQTSAFVHRKFQGELANTSHGRISRQFNPFCPLTIQDDSNWITCCFINPYMLIALPPLLQSGSQIPYEDFIAKPLCNDTQTDIKISKAVCIEQNCIYVLLLDEPYYLNGWAGVCAISSHEQLENQTLRTINHPQYFLDKQKNKMCYAQMIKRYEGQISKLGTTFKAHNLQDIIGTLIFKVEDNKPYIVGVQVIKTETKFLTEKNLKDMRKASQQHLKQKFDEQKLIDALKGEMFREGQYA